MVTFDSGSHDYQLLQREVTPSKPIQNATFAVTFWGRNGTAYFDNLSLQEKIPGNAHLP